MDRTFTVRLAARVDQYTAAMDKARAGTANFSKDTQRNLAQVGTKMQQVGSGMTRYLTLPIAAAATVAVASAIKWESAWAGVTKTVDGTAAQMRGLEQDLRDMAKSLPATHTEIAKVAEAAGALGVETESIADFTKTMIDLGETTNLTSDEAATAIAQLMNVMQTAPDQVDNLGSALVELGNNGASTERDIIMMAQRIAGAGKIVGLSESEVLGLANALASVGIEVEAGGSSISRIMTDMAKAVSTGSSELGLFAEVAGMSSEQFQAAFKDDAAGAIASFVEGLGRVQAAGGDVFTILENLGAEDVRVARALLTMSMSGDLLRESLEMGAQAWEDNSALADEAAKRYETTGARLEILRNQAVDLFIDLAQYGLPALEGLMGFAAGVIDAIQGMPQPLQVATIGFLGLVAAVGPLMKVGGAIVGNLGLIQKGMTKLGMSAGTAGAALGIVGGVVAAGVAIYGIYAREKAKAEEQTRKFTEALRAEASGQEDAVLSLITQGIATEKFASAMEAAGLTATDVASAIKGEAVPAIDDMLAAWRQAGEGGDVDNFRFALERLGMDLTTEQASTLARTIVSMGAGYESATEQVALQDKVMAELTGKTDANAASTLDAAQSAQAYADSLGLIGEEAATFMAAFDAAKMEAIAGGANEAAAANHALGAAMEAIGQGLPDVNAGMDETTVSAGDMVDAVDQVRSAFDTAASAADRYSSSVEAVFSPQANLTNSVEDLYSSMDDLKRTVADNVEEFDAAGKSLDVATEAGRRNRDGVERQVDAIKAHGDALIGTGASAEEAGYAMELLRQDLVNQAEEMGLSREEAEAYVAALGLTPESIMTAVQLDIDTAKAEQVEKLKDDLGDIPEDVAAQVDAQVEAGDLDGALETLNTFKEESAETADVTVTVSDRALLAAQASLDTFQADAARGVTIPIRTTGSLPPKVNASADGRFVDGPMLSLIGEAGAEVVLPLTRPDRMRELLADPRVGPRVAAALGAMAFADGGIIGRILQTGAAPSAGGGQSQASRMGNMHEAGALSDSDYRTYLAAQLEGLEQFSDEWMNVWRDIKALDDDEIRRQEDKAKAAKEQADAVIAEEDRKMAALHETGVISNQQYEVYLQKRLGDYTQYSADWMEKWRELSGVQEQAEREALERRELEAEQAAKRLDILFARAENRHRLAVAEGELAESWSDVQDARADVGAAKDHDERVRAEQQVADALVRVADDAWQGAKARAAYNGLAEGTSEWAQFMRSEVSAYAGAHPELSGRLNEWMLSLPKFAAGGHGVGWGIAGELGPELVNFGAGANIYNDQATKFMMSHGAFGGGSADRLLGQIVDRLDRLDGGISFNAPIHVGTRDDLAAFRREMDSMLWEKRVSL